MEHWKKAQNKECIPQWARDVVKYTEKKERIRIRDGETNRELRKKVASTGLAVEIDPGGRTSEGPDYYLGFLVF